MNTADLQTLDDVIREAWECYHGPIEELDGYIPAVPPTFWGGFRAGVQWMTGRDEDGAKC